MRPPVLVAAASAALLTLMPTPAFAQDLPPILRQERERLAAECRQMGGRFAPGPNYIQTADFNGDGVPDYLVDDNHNPCQGAQSIYCGSGGCSIEVYISSPSGHRRANLNFLGSPAVIRRGETPPRWPCPDVAAPLWCAGMAGVSRRFPRPLRGGRRVGRR